jgi:inhibitor of cysteine peptidase
LRLFSSDYEKDPLLGLAVASGYSLLTMKRILLLGLAVASVSTLIARRPPKPALVKTLTETDNGAAVTLTLKSRLTVRLPAQTGTGYSWTPKAGSSLLHLVKSYMQTPAHMLPGRTETQIFVFTPSAAGTDELELDYRRPWEKGVAPAKVFRFTATVE